MIQCVVTRIGHGALLAGCNNSDITCINETIALLFHLIHLFCYYLNLFSLYHRPKSTRLNYEINVPHPIICFIFYYTLLYILWFFYVYYCHRINLYHIITDQINYYHHGNYINNIMTTISISDVALNSLMIYGSCS